MSAVASVAVVVEVDEAAVLMIAAAMTIRTAVDEEVIRMAAEVAAGITTEAGMVARATTHRRRPTLPHHFPVETSRLPQVATTFLLHLQDGCPRLV